MSALARQQDVVEVLPHVRVLLQVNDHGSFLPPVINDELHSAHGATIEMRSRDVKLRFVSPSVGSGEFHARKRERIADDPSQPDVPNLMTDMRRSLPIPHRSVHRLPAQ